MAPGNLLQLLLDSNITSMGPIVFWCVYTHLINDSIVISATCWKLYLPERVQYRGSTSLTMFLCNTVLIAILPSASVLYPRIVRLRRCSRICNSFPFRFKKWGYYNSIGRLDITKLALWCTQNQLRLQLFIAHISKVYTQRHTQTIYCMHTAQNTKHTVNTHIPRNIRNTWWVNVSFNGISTMPDDGKEISLDRRKRLGVYTKVTTLQSSI